MFIRLILIIFNCLSNLNFKYSVVNQTTSNRKPDEWILFIYAVNTWDISILIIMNSKTIIENMLVNFILIMIFQKPKPFKLFTGNWL